MGSVNYDKFITEDLSKIPESPISELNRKAQQYDGVISLGRGEPDFHMTDFMKEAVMRALKEDETHYAPAGSIAGLNEAIADKLKKENGFAGWSMISLTVNWNSLSIKKAGRSPPLWPIWLSGTNAGV